MTRVLFWCGAGSMPRLKRVTSSCRTPSWTKVRTRAEPANRNEQAKAATATIADLLFMVLPLFLDRIIKSNHKVERAREPPDGSPRTRVWAGLDLPRYEPDLAWMRSILAPCDGQNGVVRKQHIEAVRGGVKSLDYS